MARKSAFDRLATSAARIDKLAHKADVLASRMLRSSRPATLERQAREGKKVERQLRKAESRFREIERSLTRTTPGQRRREAQRQVELRQAREAEEVQRRIIAGEVSQVFQVQGSYHSRKNHGINMEIELTYFGAHLDTDTAKGATVVGNAVKALAAGQMPLGFEVAIVEYGPTARRRVARSQGDFERISGAIQEMALHVKDVTIGERD